MLSQAEIIVQFSSIHCRPKQVNILQKRPSGDESKFSWQL